MFVSNNGKTKWFNKLDECVNSPAVHILAHFTRNNNTLSAVFKDSLSMKNFVILQNVKNEKRLHFAQCA